MRLSGVLGCVAVAALVAGCGSTATTASMPVAAAATAAFSVPPTASSAPGARPVDAPVAAALPPGVPTPPPSTGQLITVTVAGPTSTTGIVQAWQHTASGWQRMLGPVDVKVGINGVRPTHEGMHRTPIGLFPVPSAFGRLPNPGTRMPYRQVDDSDWWVSDTTSPDYNTYQRCAPGTCPFDEKAGEDLGESGASYDYAAVIGYNVAPVIPGAGSAFFLHVDAGVPSEGCVETPRASVIALLRLLDPAQHPMINIGYGR